MDSLKSHNVIQNNWIKMNIIKVRSEFITKNDVRWMQEEAYKAKHTNSHREKGKRIEEDVTKWYGLNNTWSIENQKGARKNRPSKEAEWMKNKNQKARSKNQKN